MCGVFKLLADPKAFPIIFKVGQISAAAISLQAFAEAQHALTTGKAMSGEERYRSILQNVILTVTLEAGRFITKPIEQRIEASIGAKLKVVFEKELNNLQTDRAALTDQLAKLERGQASHDEIATLLENIQDLRPKEIKLISDGVQRKAITQPEADKATAGYRDQDPQQLELRLSQIGIELPLSQGAPSFRPLVLGVVAFNPNARPVIEAFYKKAGGKFTKSSAFPDLWEGRLPTSELTFYVPEGVTPKSIPSIQKIVAARRPGLARKPLATRSPREG